MADVTLGRHSVMYCLLDGQLLTRETSMTIDQDGQIQDVDTVVLGFSGWTVGSPKANVTIENALPEDDMEQNPTPKIRIGAVVEIGAIVSGRQMVAKGVLKKVNYKHGVNQNAVQSIEGTFRMSDFE